MLLQDASQVQEFFVCCQAANPSATQRDDNIPVKSDT